MGSDWQHPKGYFILLSGICSPSAQKQFSIHYDSPESSCACVCVYVSPSTLERWLSENSAFSPAVVRSSIHENNDSACHPIVQFEGSASMCNVHAILCDFFSSFSELSTKIEFHFGRENWNFWKQVQYHYGDNGVSLGSVCAGVQNGVSQLSHAGTWLQAYVAWMQKSYCLKWFFSHLDIKLNLI